jgi:hypothetical protein
MAAGDLSPDQSRYVDRVAAGTGLDRRVVVAWVGAESGWGINKAGHNYLNVGPGETYPSVDQAAARVVGLINGSSNYYGIRAAIPAGPAAQVQAIAASPWGTSGTTLAAVYSQLVGGGPTATLVSTQGVTPQDPGGSQPTIVIPGWDPSKNLQRGLPDPVTGVAKDILGALGPILLSAGLTVVFTVAAFAFIAMGVNRLTGAPPKGIFDTVSGAVGTAAGAAKLAAI